MGSHEKMPALRDIALTVEERGTNQFFWVLLEALSSDQTDAILYQRMQTASIPQPKYSDALVVGAHALRKLMGSNTPPPDGT
jgi:predicted solute-binding protein